MGLVIGLRGPGETTWSKQKEKRKCKQAQSMTLVRYQQYMLELVATLLASRGFIVFVGSRLNKAWKYNGLQALLNNPKEHFTVLDLHSCWFLRASACTTLRIATNHSVDHSVKQEHHASCPGPGDKQDKRQLL